MRRMRRRRSGGGGTTGAHVHSARRLCKASMMRRPPEEQSAVADRSRRPSASANGSILPAELLFGVLLLLPAKEVCRLRLVCRSWRSLISDPVFTEAHSSRHPLVAGLVSHRNGSQQVQILDISGNIVKRASVARWRDVQLSMLPHECAIWLGPGVRQVSPWCSTYRSPLDRAVPDRLELSTQGVMACVSRSTGEARVLDLSTGTVTVLPAATKNDAERRLYDGASTCLLASVPSTGAYKVLRINDTLPEPSCEVATLGGGGKDEIRWRVAPRPPVCDCVLSCTSPYRAVVRGVVYFLMLSCGRCCTGPGSIASFDLATEQWRRTLEGPPCVDDGPDSCTSLGLDDLNGSLVGAHRRYKTCSTELWFMEGEGTESSWTKRYSLPWFDRHGKFCLLVVLYDERILVWVKEEGALRAYDPTASTWANLARVHDYIQTGISYTGGLLSL